MLCLTLWQVEACIEFDCDYVDVNGEVPFTHKVTLNDGPSSATVAIWECN